MSQHLGLLPLAGADGVLTVGDFFDYTQLLELPLGQTAMMSYCVGHKEAEEQNMYTVIYDTLPAAQPPHQPAQVDA